MNNVDIRDKLKAFLWDKGYSQKRVAEMANLSDSKLSAILLKRRKLDANELFDICNAIEITPSELREYKREDKAS